MRRETVLLAGSLAAFAAAGACLAAGAPPWVSLIAAAPVVTFLPGAALLIALGMEPSAVAGSALAVGLSLALTVLGGLALGSFGWLTPIGWLVWLAAATLGGAVVGLLRSPAARPRWQGFQPLRRLRPRHLVLCGATLVVAVLTVKNAARHGNEYLPFPFTDFWLLPEAGRSNLYLVGIRNGERAGELRFTVRVMVDSEPVAAWQVEVPEGATVTRTVALPAGRKAVAWLLRGTEPLEVYRMASAALPHLQAAEAN
jgi:hypothetical protein